MNKNELEENKIKKNSPQLQVGPGRFAMAGMKEKPKNFKKSLGKLLLYCKKYLIVIIIATVLAIIGTIFNVIGPDKISQITNLITDGIVSGSILGITNGIEMDKIKSIAILLIVLYSLGFIFNYIQGYIMATISQRISNNLRSDISAKINKLPFKYFDSTSYGNVLSRVTNDVDMIGQTLNQSLGTLITAIVMFFGALIMMFVTSWILAISAILATFIGFFIMIIIISKSQKYFKTQQQELGKLNGHIEEMYSGHSVVKLYNGEAEAISIFNESNKKLLKSSWKSQFLSGLMMPIMNFIGNFGYVVVCIVGALLIRDNKISFGVIVAFMIYIRLFTQPLSQLAQAASNLQSGAAASERVFEFLDEEELADESHKTFSLDKIKGNVEFKNVRFSYNEDKVIINNFSASVKAGEKVAIVGPTGAGKTTMVNLLMRFYEVKSGQILIDGIPITDLKRENIHELFCMVLQDTWLFEGTIKENIIYNKKGISLEEVISACKAVGIDHFIHTLPKGYETILDDKLNISAGQKQLLTIARAMIENAPLLILDEATSSVDTRTEVLIQKAMDKLMVGRTSFVIAHRLSTIKNANLILVMNDGDIIESGTHKELLSNQGFYSELYNSQFEKVE